MAIDASITGTPLGAITGSVTNADDGTINGTIGFVATGTISSTMGVPGPAGSPGATGPQGPQGIPGPPGEGGTWGSIVGTLSDQTDLQTALNGKYSTSNPAGYITSSALSPYLTSATAASTYQTLAGMSSYLTTSAAAAGYYPLTGNPSGFLTAASLSGYATESWVTGQGYITSAALTGYATESFVTSQGYITSSALTPYLSKADNLASVASVSTARDNLGLGSLSTPTFAGVTVQGSGSNVANLTPTSLSLTHATSGSFTIQPSVGITFPDASVQTTAYTGSTPDYITSVSSPLSVTSGNLTIDLSPYALLSGATFTGTLSAPTPSPGTDSTVVATTEWVKQLEYAPLNSPQFVGNPRGPTPSLSDDDTSLATTAFVKGQGYLTSASLTGYAQLSGATFTGVVGFNGASGGIAAKSTGWFKAYTSGSESTDYSLQYDTGFQVVVGGTTVARLGATGILAPSSGITFSDASVQTTAFTGFSGYATESWVTAGFYPLTGNPASYLVAADIAGKANLASPALTGNVTITTNSASPALFITQTGTGNILTLHDQASDTTFVAIDQNGKVNTIASTTANAGFNVPHGTAPTSPVNGDIWTTTGNIQWRRNGGTATIPNTTTGNTFSAGQKQTVSHSSTSAGFNIGPVANDPSTLANGDLWHNSTTLKLRARVNGVSQSIATEAYVDTADALKANLASPTFTGVPAAPTASPGTNTTQLATTAFVTAAVSASTGATWGSITGTLSSQTDLQSALDAKLSTATAASTYQTLSGMSSYLTTSTAASTYQTIAGMSSYLTTASAASTYAPLASPALTGNPTAPTPLTADNDTSIATTAFVKAQGYLTSAPVTSVAGRTGAVTLSTSDISGLGTMATATAADYSTTTVANGLYYPLASNPAGYLTSAPVTSVAGRTGAITLAVADVSGAAPLASPALTGTPTAPTATAGTNTTQIATTEFVRADNNCKAWVNFNGTGTVAIRASMNVTSITDNGTGDYTVNFTNALVDANYAAVGLTGITPGTGGSFGYISFERLNTGQTFLRTSSSFRFNTTSGAANLDSASLNLAIFR